MTFLSRFPRLSYNVTRDITWPWLAPTVYALGLVALAIIITLNVALTGYETVVIKSHDFNATQFLWYNHFTGPEKPGSRCSSFNFTVGDTIYTTNALFEYTLTGTGSGLTNRTISYSGQNLAEGCDLDYITVDGDVVARTVSIITHVRCQKSGFPILFKSTFVSSPFGSISTLSEFSNDLDRTEVSDAVKVIPIIDAVGSDLLDQMQALASTGLSPVTALSALAMMSDPSQPLRGHANSTTPGFLTDPPFWTFYWQYMGGVNGSSLAPPTTPGETPQNTKGPLFFSSNTFLNPNLTALYLPALSNIVQATAAAFRLDLGIPYPNNLLLNDTMFGQIAFQTLPEYTQALQILNVLPGRFPNGWPTGARLNAQFDCRFQYPKSWGSAVVAILVATLTFFMTGWGIIMWVITWFATRGNGNNRCCEAYAQGLTSAHRRKEEEASLMSADAPNSQA